MKEEESMNGLKPTKEEYNSIPVYFCNNCGSLDIRYTKSGNVEYCDKCGSTDIKKCSIEAWLEFKKH